MCGEKNPVRILSSLMEYLICNTIMLVRICIIEIHENSVLFATRRTYARAYESSMAINTESKQNSPFLLSFQWSSEEGNDPPTHP